MRSARLYALTALVAASAYALDQVTKWFFFGNPAFVGFSVIPNVLSWIDHHNEGITFNLPVPRIFILIFTALIVCGICRLLVQAIKKGELLQALALGLVIGGAAGNFTDRLILAYVRDWILLFNRSAINVADLAIGSGLVWYFFTTKRPHPPVSPLIPPQSAL